MLHYISNRDEIVNTVDGMFIKSFASSLRLFKSDKTRKTWNAAMEASVLMLSDTQVFTGLAILICGYTQLTKGLDAYHWETVVDLAWFSSLSHLATLSSLRNYFRSRRIMACCRAGLMGVVLVMLCVSYGTIGYLPQSQGTGNITFASWPAKCLFSPRSMRELEASDPRWTSFDGRTQYNSPLVVLSVGFLLISYITRVARIFAPPDHIACFKMPRPALGSSCPRCRSSSHRHQSIYDQVTHLLLFVLATMIIALSDVVSSMLWEVRPYQLFTHWKFRADIDVSKDPMARGSFSMGYAQTTFTSIQCRIQASWREHLGIRPNPTITTFGASPLVNLWQRHWYISYPCFIFRAFCWKTHIEQMYISRELSPPASPSFTLPITSTEELHLPTEIAEDIVLTATFADDIDPRMMAAEDLILPTTMAEVSSHVPDDTRSCMWSTETIRDDTSDTDWDDYAFDYSKYIWYPKLIAMLFGFAMIFMASLLYNFPASSINVNRSWYTDKIGDFVSFSIMAEQYLILLAICIFFSVLFTSLCIAYQWSYLRDIPFPKTVLAIDLSGKKIIPHLLWYLIVLSFLTATFLLDWYLFDGPTEILNHYNPASDCSTQGSSFCSWTMPR